MRIQNWSFTRASLYHNCPLAFFFSGPSYKPLALRENTLPLKSAVNLHALVGIAVHGAIAEQMARWRDGLQPDLRKTQMQAGKLIERALRNPIQHIIEAANGQHLDDSLLPKFIHISRARIHTFFFAVWPQFEGHTYVSHETLKAYPLNQYQVRVRVDLCTRNPEGMLVISDWKTGLPANFPGEHFQLGIYAHWGAYEFAEQPEDIVVQIANLRTGEVTARQLTSPQLDQVVGQVLGDLKLWASPSQSDFPADPEFGKCYSCRSLNLCAEGQEVIKLPR